MIPSPGFQSPGPFQPPKLPPGADSPGRHDRPPLRSCPVPDQPIHLEIRDLAFSYARGCPVLPGISHAFAPASLTAIVGPNGAGKSTLLKLMTGMLTPESGGVFVGGEAIASLSASQRASKLVYIPQRSAIAFPFSVRQVVAMGRYAAGESPRSAAVDRALDMAEIRELADIPVGNLSIGQQQRVTLARAIAQIDRGDGTPGAMVLLADEPVSALDPAHAVHAMKALRQLASRGLSVVAVLHDLGLVMRWADRALLLDASGKIAASGPVHEALTPEQAARVFGTAFEPLTDRAGRVASLAPASVSPDQQA